MTRDELIETAAQVFRQKGYHGASMEDIATAVRAKLRLLCFSRFVSAWYLDFLKGVWLFS
ncbi:MAG: TetR family transcriptional regulator [Anaerolineales bacterium]